MTKTEQLAQALSAVLDDSPLGQDEKLKALGMARTQLNRAHSTDMGQWRRERVQHGPVGTGKKTEELRSSANSNRTRK